MLTLSAEAAATLAAILERAEVEPDEGLRLERAGEDLVLRLDVPREGDRIILLNGRVGVIVGARIEAEVGESVVDLEQNAHGMRLIIR